MNDEPDFLNEDGGRSEQASKHTIERYKLELARRLQGSPTRRDRFEGGSEVKEEQQEH